MSASLDFLAQLLCFLVVGIKNVRLRRFELILSKKKQFRVSLNNIKVRSVVSSLGVLQLFIPPGNDTHVFEYQQINIFDV